MKNLLLALLLCLAVSGVALAGPVISVVVPVYDFGSVVAGFAVSHTFVITNTGDEDLRISGVSASCGCTTTNDLRDTVIAPGASVDLEALVNTAGFHGTIAKNITIYSNDEGTPMLTLRITGQVLSAEVYNISVSDAGYLLYLLIDLRAPEDYAAHHLLGAVNIPAGDLAERLADLPQEAFIILYDTAFEESEAAALAMRAEGFYTTYALVGGLDEWVRRYGMKNLTNPEEAYIPGPQVDYSYAQGERPQHLMLFDELDSIFLLYVDVRTQGEYAAGHIMGAVNIPYADLSASANSLPVRVPLIVYDQTGALGDQAALWLINNDFASAQSMLGGLDEWIRQYGDTFLFTGQE